MNKSINYVFPWKVTGEDYDGHIVVRWFRTKVTAQKWAIANLIEIWRIEHV